MLRSRSFFLVLGLVLSGFGSSADAGPFIPKRPEDIIPHKPEDVISQFPNNSDLPSRQRTVTFDYTLWNDSGRTVRFRLPSGREYTLRNGERGNYKFTGHKSDATLYVFSTGHTYHLHGGDHKFWWMSQESRFGLDLDYRK